MSTATLPKTTKAWTVEGKTGFESLKFHEEFPVEAPGDYEVLVKFHAASLNYRDLIIPKGQYPFPLNNGVVPGSDGAGEVIAVGPKVTRFQKGSKVLTLFNQGHISRSLTPLSLATGLGGTLNGTLRQYASFPESGLVTMPSNLSYIEGSTLSCAALTAYNALFGLRPLIPGQTILTQGTGGVSIFALQFGKLTGCKVISTTSSAKKAKILKDLGADEVINYRDTPEWGDKVQELTGGVGVDHVIEVAGPKSMKESLKAIKIDGIISIIGFLGGAKGEEPGFLEVLGNVCTVRGILVGNRDLFEDMNRMIEVNGMKPVVDEKVFTLEEAKDAYQYMWDQKHFGKLTIKIE